MLAQFCETKSSQNTQNATNLAVLKLIHAARKLQRRQNDKQGEKESIKT